MSSCKLHCIIDCSGSMAEYGKPMLIVNLLRYIRQFTVQHSISAHYLNWSSQILETSWHVDHDVDIPAAEGRSDISVVCEWAKSHPDTTLLMLTDGYFELKAEQRHQLSLLENLFLIGVGGDVNLVQLKTLSEHCYSAEKIDQVLHMINRPQLVMTQPLRRINISSDVSSEDDSDWE